MTDIITAWATQAADAIVKALPDNRPLALHEPDLTGRESELVADCIKSNWVSYGGPYVAKFESLLAAQCGVPHAIATVNGTAALHLALILAGVEAGDEVLAPSLTFIASINAISYCGAQPHFIDSDPITLGLDPRKLAAHLQRIGRRTARGLENIETGRRIRALLPVHIFGFPAEMEALTQIAADFGLAVVEDAAEGIGISSNGQPLGSLAPIATLSFNGNKVITTGGGGAILIKDDALAERARHISTTAKLKHAWRFDHDEIAYNYRMPALNAALGCAQLERLDGFMRNKARLLRHYQSSLRDVPGLKILDMPKGAGPAPWLISALTPDAEHRDALLGALHERRIFARPVWTLNHRQAPYADCFAGDLSAADALEARLISLPSSPGLIDLIHDR
jgi:perosamine synthetase